MELSIAQTTQHHMIGYLEKKKCTYYHKKQSHSPLAYCLGGGLVGLRATMIGQNILWVTVTNCAPHVQDSNIPASYNLDL